MLISWSKCRVGLMGLCMAVPLCAAAQVPIGAAPNWVKVDKGAGATIEYETTGVYTKGEYTYVALRDLDKRDQGFYVLMVHAFQCGKQRVSMALMGRMSLDGSSRDLGKMNEERILAKYSDAIPVPDYPHLTPIHAAVCVKR